MRAGDRAIEPAAAAMKRPTGEEFLFHKFHKILKETCACACTLTHSRGCSCPHVGVPVMTSTASYVRGSTCLRVCVCVCRPTGPEPSAV